MAVVSEDFYDHAERVSIQWNDEISRRCLVSRGYYSAFHLLRDNFPIRRRRRKDDRGSHQLIIDYLFSINERHLANDFKMLKKKRENADYDIDLNFSQHWSEQFLEDLDEFISKAKTLIP